MSSGVRFRNDMTVRLLRESARDEDVVRAARVSTQGEASQTETGEAEGLIRYLMANRHGSPFEHNSMTFYVEAPIFVFREFMRHRIASYNEESARYKQLDPVFYVPSPDRPLVQTGKTGHYQFVAGTKEQYDLVTYSTMWACHDAYYHYLSMISYGVAREVARGVLPVSIYSSMYVTMNARSLMNFLSLRVKSDDSTFTSYPQYEIQMVAEQMEQAWAQMMPITYAAFVKNGRIAP